MSFWNRFKAKSVSPVQVVRRGQFCEHDTISSLRHAVHAMALRGADTFFAYKAYDAASPVATAVDLIAESLADIKPIVFDKQLNEFTTKQDILKFLNDPGFGQDWRSFIIDAAVSFLLTRNTYLNLLGNTKRQPIAMANIKPFWVTHDVSQTDGYIDAFHVNKPTIGNGQIRYSRTSLKEWRFTANNLNELIHVRGQTDETGLIGNSPIVALMLTILQNVAGGQHNASLLSNGTRPSGALVATGELSDTQFSRLKEQIDAEKSGPDNAGKPLLLEGGMQWSEMSVSNKDMDFLALLNMGKEDVWNRYKVPIGLLSPKAMTLNNYQTSVVTLYDLAVLPLLKTLLGGMSRVIMPRFGMDIDRFQLTFDPTSVSASMIKTSEKVKLMSEINAFTMNELRREFGQEAIEGGNVVLVPSTQVPAGTDIRTDDEPTAESADERDDAKKTFVQLAKKAGLSKNHAEKLWVTKT